MSEQTNPIISFKNFSFQYRAQKKPTLHDINLDIYPGERVLIAGPSGSGKSTLAACINGLNPFSNPGECTGSLTVDGVVGRNTWNALQNVYEQTLYTLPADYQEFAREVYPGRFLVLGDTGPEVTLLQTRLNQMAARDSTLPTVAVDGVYGQETARAVRAVQRSLGYSATGAVGPVLWSYIITQGQGYGVF